MHDLEYLFDKETISNISFLVSEKMPILNQIPDFKEMDEKFATALEKLENSIPEDLSQDLKTVMKLNSKVLDYYFALAYYIGMKHGKIM